MASDIFRQAGAPAGETPSVCPFCGSGEVSATAKKVTDDSYWRCAPCGQVWNPVRLRRGGGDHGRRFILPRPGFRP